MTPASFLVRHPLAKEIIAPKTCVGLLHRGPYHEIGDTFRKFFSSTIMMDEKTTKTKAAGCCGASTRDGKVLGLYLDNPDCTKPEDLRSYAALEIDGKDNKAMTEELPVDWKKVEVAGGPAAVMTVTGSYSQLAEAWKSFGKRVAEEGWQFSSKPEHISQEVYVDMDRNDESKNVTKLIMFLEE